MKYYRFKIKPLSPFGTYPYSDTIFGQLIWTLKEQGIDIEELLKDYESNPFMVTSDFLMENLGNVPKLPADFSKVTSKEDKINKIISRKTLKKRAYVNIDKLYDENTISHDSLFDVNGISQILAPLGNKKREEKNDDIIYIKEIETIHNTINRFIGSTTVGHFAPYYVNDYYFENIFFYLYVFIDENRLSIPELVSAITLLGKWGFGKDASIGRGFFDVIEKKEIEYRFDGKNALYTLGNCVLEGMSASEYYYDTITRFGKHGNIRAVSGNPFKNPIVMAKQGAVIISSKEDLINKPYIGKGLKGNISFYQDTVHQGYSLYIPIALGENNE